MVCIFSLYYKTLKKGRREIKRERKKEKRVREQPPPPIICGFSLALLCVCVHGEDSCINRNTNSRTTNSSEACGLRTHFYTGHMGYALLVVSTATHSSCWITGNCSYWMWPQFGRWMCRLQCKLQSVHLWIGSYRACKMYKSLVVKSALF